MGGVTDAIFGSEGESSSVEDITPREYVRLRGPTANQLQQIFSAGGLPAAPGPFAAPLTSTEQALIARAGQVAGATPVPNQASQDLAASAYQQALTPGQVPQVAQPFLSALLPVATGTYQPTATQQGLIEQAVSSVQGGAALTPQEQSFLNQIGQLSTQPSQLTGAANQQLLQTVMGQGLSPDSNPFLAATIDAATRPILETFEQDTLPGLRGLFTRAGQQVQNLGSSPFAEALARERTGVANAIGDVATNLAGQNFQAERARQQQATLAAPGFQDADLQRALQGLQASLGARQAGQQVGQADINRILSGLQATINPALAAEQLGGLATNRVTQGASTALNAAATGENLAQSQMGRLLQGQQAAITPEIAAQQISQADLERISQGLEAVALPRLVEQFGLDRGLEEFRRRQQSLLEALRIAGSISSPQPVTIPGSEGSSGLLGGVASGLGFAAGGPIGAAIGGLF